jgi:hypothetical protein
MEYKSFIELVRQECRFLENDGYTFREVDRNIWYEKVGETEGQGISFAYTIYGNNFHVNALGAYKRFNAVEIFLQKRLGGELINYYTINIDPNESDLPTDLPYTKTKNNYHFEIITSAQLISFLGSVKKFYEQTVKPFYQTYTSLAEVHNKLSNLKNPELASFISNASNLLFARVFIIKSFIEPSIGEEYYQYISNELSKLKGNVTIDGLSKQLDDIRAEIRH